MICDNTVARECPMCGSTWYMDLDDDEFRHLEEYYDGWGLIQELLPDLNRCEREFSQKRILCGMSKILFGNGDTERIYWNAEYRYKKPSQFPARVDFQTAIGIFVICGPC